MLSINCNLDSDTFIPLRVVDTSLLLPGDEGASGHLTGYLRWLLHSPQPTGSIVTSQLREESGGGIELKHWSVLPYFFEWYPHVK